MSKEVGGEAGASTRHPRSGPQGIWTGIGTWSEKLLFVFFAFLLVDGYQLHVV